MFFAVQIPNLQSVFFRLALENTDNPEKTNFSGLSRFSGVGLNMGFIICFGSSKKPLLITRQFRKLPLIRRFTVANPEYQLYFMPISPNWKTHLLLSHVLALEF